MKTAVGSQEDCGGDAGLDWEPVKADDNWSDVLPGFSEGDNSMLKYKLTFLSFSIFSFTVTLKPDSRAKVW